MSTLTIESVELSMLEAFLHEAKLSGQFEWRESSLDGPLVAARDGDRIVGAGRLYRNRLHPARWRLSLFVEPRQRQRGVGSAMLDALIEMLPSGDRALQVATAAINAPGVAFLARHGFEPLMTTRIGTLEPAAIPELWWINASAAHDEAEDAGVRMVTLAERPDLFEAAVIAHETVYRDQHAWNPPSELTSERAGELFLDPEELRPNWQLLAITGGQVAGIASLRATADPAVVDLGWIGTIDLPPDLEDMAILALLGRCLVEAARSSATIALEIDRVDPAVNRAIDTLPVKWEPDWLTFAW